MNSEINLHLGDCMEAMAKMPDNAYDLAIVDPPYGIDIAKWDKIKMKPNDNYFKELFRVSQNQIIWGANYFTLPHNQGWICWDKTLKNGKTALPRKSKSEFELAWCSCETKAIFFRYTYDGNIQGFNGGSVDYTFKSIHPTQKPVKLYEWLLMNYAKEGDKILDTHLGSGSIAIACHDGGFALDAWEIDAEYHKAATERFNTHIKQLRLL